MHSNSSNAGEEQQEWSELVGLPHLSLSRYSIPSNAGEEQQEWTELVCLSSQVEEETYELQTATGATPAASATTGKVCAASPTGCSFLSSPLNPGEEQ